MGALGVGSMGWMRRCSALALLLLACMGSAIQPSEVEEAMAKAQMDVAAARQGLPADAILTAAEEKIKGEQADKAEEAMDSAAEKLEAGLMTEGVMAAATDQAERLSNLDINHAQSVLAKAKETHQELSDQAKLLSNPNYDADTAASEAEAYVKAVREGTDGALLKVSIEKEQAERHLHHAKEFAAQETAKTAQLVEPLQAELAAKQAGGADPAVIKSIQDQVDAAEHAAKLAREAEITAKTDVEQIVAAQKGVAQEGTYTNKMLSKEKDLIDK